ncbi:hypothetical protein [uncultured Sphingomonas sp.]|uniref:hypothetical protein n=1 Tax=uncultured Sphingomonas sp. TaxID=158754 RepID=UPI00260F2EDF|nr:hypothetical protein [uncultured Sphingomonas sp.]
MPALTILATASDGAHSGTIRQRTAPELSDIALFALAILAVALTRRALRRRMRKPPPDG